MFDLFALPEARSNALRPLPDPLPEGMEIGEVTLRFKNEPPLTVPAYRVGALAVHRTVTTTERWGVSHADTGRLIRAFDDLAAALDCARQAVHALDWSQLRLGDTPEILVGWTPERAAQLIAAIGPGEPNG